MKAIYKFEEEVFDEIGVDGFCPVPKGYDADELNDMDRQEVSGMIYAISTILREKAGAFVEDDDEDATMIDKIKAEIFAETCDELIESIQIEICDFIISRLDSDE